MYRQGHGKDQIEILKVQKGSDKFHEVERDWMSFQEYKENLLYCLY